MTPGKPTGSRFLFAAIIGVISAGCGSRGEAEPTPHRPPAAPRDRTAAPEDVTKDPAVRPEVCLGVADQGIWPDLDDKVQITLPAQLAAQRVTARLDRKHNLLVLSIDGFPRKIYPLGGSASLELGPHKLAIRPGDRAELARLVAADRITEAPAAHDHDGDGIPDPLDVLIGAKKTVLNADAYTEGYMDMKYPMGDVPRGVGVCTDVIIRAVRNAGIDLQQELHDDLGRARAAYPMIKGRGNPQIDQRRVLSLLPYFTRHWQARTARLDDAGDPLRPGDVVFMDTFPSKSGPDHIGIVSDTIGESGLPMIINNWTNGTVTAEMDLLAFVPVLYRFRLPE
ncbi:MAG: NADH:ubiquinone oxidoreductase [Deltaproteobacteria bacterium]|nr:NADH:ubiquinone oxidoreductase [Deltaproteobacteria bacterium]